MFNIYSLKINPLYVNINTLIVKKKKKLFSKTNKKISEKSGFVSHFCQC